MNRHFLARHSRIISITSLLWGILGAIAPIAAQADVPLTRAEIESVYNQVEFLPQGQTARPATLADWLAIGDALRTGVSSRAELSFNDGSLARIGESATFWFVPNTRDFRLSNGTALFLIPPGRGPSTIQTPSAVTGIQGTAVVVRHIPLQIDAAASGAAGPVACQGRTILMVLTDNPKGPVEVTTCGGNTQTLTSGHMAIIEGETIQVLEFDLRLFYRTSSLVEGLNLDDPTYEGSGLPTDPVRQETLDGIATQGEFVGGYLLNPEVLNASSQLASTANWLTPAESTLTPFPTANLAPGPGTVGNAPTQASQSQSRPLNLMSSRFGGNLPGTDPNRIPVPGGILNPPSANRPTTTVTSSAPSQPTLPKPAGSTAQPQPVSTPVPDKPVPTAMPTTPLTPVVSPTSPPTTAGPTPTQPLNPPGALNPTPQPTAPVAPANPVPQPNPNPGTMPVVTPPAFTPPGPVNPTPDNTPATNPGNTFTPPGPVNPTPDNTPATNPGGTFTPPGPVNPTPDNTPAANPGGAFTPPGPVNPTPDNTPTIVPPSPFSPVGDFNPTPSTPPGTEGINALPNQIDPLPNNTPTDTNTTLPDNTLPAGLFQAEPPATIEPVPAEL